MGKNKRQCSFCFYCYTFSSSRTSMILCSNHIVFFFSLSLMFTPNEMIWNERRCWLLGRRQWWPVIRGQSWLSELWENHQNMGKKDPSESGVRVKGKRSVSWWIWGQRRMTEREKDERVKEVVFITTRILAYFMADIVLSTHYLIWSSSQHCEVNTIISIL